DMAGASLTVTWLDGELEQPWLAPAYTPAYRRGTGSPRAAGAQYSDGARTRDDAGAGTTDGSPVPEPTAAQREINARMIDLLAVARDAIDETHVHLGELDSFAGDGDHGTGMLRGLDAALAYARKHAEVRPPQHLLTEAGDAWSETAGGTS